MQHLHASKTMRIRLMALCALLLPFLGTVSVAAATYEEATWYYGKFNIANNLKVADGSGIKIALIDGSIDPSVPELADAKIVTQPASECLLNGSADPINATTDATHATQMAVVLAGNGKGSWDGRGGKGIAPGATILHYRNSTDQVSGTGIECINAEGVDKYDDATAHAIRDAQRQGARIVNMSFGGNVSMPLTAEAMSEAEHQGVLFVAASDDKPNSTDPERLGYPTKYNGVVVVNGVTPELKLDNYSSTSNLVSILGPGNTMAVGGINPATGKWDSTGVFGGSSMATAFVSGIIADAMSKSPKATGNQIIQLMLRTTGGTYHAIPSRTNDGYGFGTVSLTTMFEHDPTKLPDNNPLLRDDAEPLTADIIGNSQAPAKTPAKQTDGGKLEKVLAIIASVVVLAAVVTVLLLYWRRKHRPSDGTKPDDSAV